MGNIHTKKNRINKSKLYQEQMNEKSIFFDKYKINSIFIDRNNKKPNAIVTTFIEISDEQKNDIISKQKLPSDTIFLVNDKKVELISGPEKIYHKKNPLVKNPLKYKIKNFFYNIQDNIDVIKKNKESVKEDEQIETYLMVNYKLKSISRNPPIVTSFIELSDCHKNDIIKRKNLPSYTVFLVDENKEEYLLSGPERIYHTKGLKKVRHFSLF